MAQSTSSSDPMAGATAPAQDAQKQLADGSWPKPGDEGYVNPDGTPQAAQQLEDNRRAAADRAAAGSIIHGAPGAERGGNADAVNAAVARAQSYSGPSNDDRDAALTESIRAGQADQPQAQRAGGQANADDSKPKSTR